MFPAPCLRAFAEPPPDTSRAMPLAHNESADQAELGTLQAPFNRDLNPSDNFLAQTSDKCGLLILALREPRNPITDLARAAFVS